MTCPVRYTVHAVDRSTSARAGRLQLARGTVETPVFMPVGTQAALRAVAPTFLPDIGVQILLANTYHLHQRPGEAVIAKLGGLHRFMGVDLPILTDSGGFQVFSLDTVEVGEGSAPKLLRLIETLEDHDDVQKVFSNFQIDDQVLARLTS